MSFKYTAVKVAENHYVLPKVAAMRTDVHAFLSDALYEASDEGLWQQISSGASYEGVIGAYLMPDCHLGFGVPVGSVIVTEDTLIQAGSGYDISCGVVHMRVPGLTAKDVRDKATRRHWVDEVEKRIATGIGSHRAGGARTFTNRQLDEIFLHGAKALGIKAELCERQFIQVDEGLDLNKLEAARSRALPQPNNRREDSWLRADEPMGKDYWAYHNTAANYAIANRHIIVEGVQESLEEVFHVRGDVYYEISHNLVQEETLVLPDGTHEKGFVHRKGATRAFPAGHPDLMGGRWETTGHPCLVPGSMFTGAAILFPLAGAYQAGCSVNHGSGRVLGRGAAKRQLEHMQGSIDDEMATVERVFGDVTVEGIVGNTAKTPLDECGHVYKDLDAVLAVLEGCNIARVAHRLYPVCSIKGTD